jgi:hypothetical protein
VASRSGWSKMERTRVATSAQEALGTREARFSVNRPSDRPPAGSTKLASTGGTLNERSWPWTCESY